MIRQVFKSIKPLFTAFKQQRLPAQQVANGVKSQLHQWWHPSGPYVHRKPNPDLLFLKPAHEFCVHENVRKARMGGRNTFPAFFFPRTSAAGFATAAVFLQTTPAHTEGVVHRFNIESKVPFNSINSNNLSKLEEIIDEFDTPKPFVSLAAFTAHSVSMATPPVDIKKMFTQMAKQSKKITELRKELVEAKDAVKAEEEKNQQLAAEIETLKKENDSLKKSLFERDDACIICCEKMPNVVYGCKHCVVCESCDKELMKRNIDDCPNCRAPIRTRIAFLRA
jgi:hypothetical protein